MEAALNILKKTPPADLEKTLAGLQALAGDHDAEVVDALKERLQLPFGIEEQEEDEAEAGEKRFLKCPYNKRGDKYRSPWTNLTYPGKQKVQLSSPEDEEVRFMEECANDVWESYTSLYYGSEAVGSVFLSKYPIGVFQGLFGIRKDCPTGSWNSAHLVQVEKPTDGGKQLFCTYHVQSTVVIALNTGASENPNNKVQISASVARNTTQTHKVSKVFMKSNHIENIGTIIEDIEIDIRSSFERVHIPRTQEMVDAIQRETEKRGTQNLAMNMMMMQSDAFKQRREKMQSEGQ